MSKTYDIGYGKPPPSKQFAKGQSGNPKGRPKRDKTWKAPPSMETMIYQTAHRKITVKMGGKSQEIMLMQALIDRIFYEAAAQGNKQACKLALGLLADVEANPMKLDPEGQTSPNEAYQSPQVRMAQHARMGKLAERLRLFLDSKAAEELGVDHDEPS